MRVKLKIIFIILIVLQYSITFAQHQSWVSRYTGVVPNGFDKANSITIDNDGNVYVTGSSVNPDNSGSIATVKYNASGTQIWASRYSGNIYSNGIIDEGSSIAVYNTTQGVFVYVTGTTITGLYKSDFITIQYYPDGTERWVQRYHGNFNGTNDYNRGNHIEVDNNGNAYVTGYITDIGTDWDYTTIKYDTKEYKNGWCRMMVTDIMI